MNACIPINRENPGKSFMSGALRTFERGDVLGIFPQGRIQVPGEPDFEPLAGVGAIALRTGVPVIPVHISGTQYRDNPFASFFIRHHVRVRYGKPIDLSAYKGRERDKDAAREVAALIMQRIQELGRADEAAAATTP
jgi:1-acyl-sn-glycerol-3-phosphate acyltransferase